MKTLFRHFVLNCSTFESNHPYLAYISFWIFLLALPAVGIFGICLCMPGTTFRCIPAGIVCLITGWTGFISLITWLVTDGTI